MLKNLKRQLLAGSCAVVLLLVSSARLAIMNQVELAVALIIVSIGVVIFLNIWFRRSVTDPLEELTEIADRIAEGSYGTKAENYPSDEIGALAETMNEMSDKIAQADKAQTDFVSQVSHELRTPLTAITGWAETIGYDEAVQGDSKRGIQIISREAERLSGMVAELLEFTRIQDGRFNLRMELIDVAAELEDAIFTYGELMKQSGIEVNYTQPETEVPLISADEERLKQVFLNLLDNAMTHGGDGKRIDVNLTVAENELRISFRDYGAGIPSAELPHVKEKFYKGSSKNRGTGIGLAVCDEIVTRHGGTLLIENAEPIGCIATILLPLQAS